MSKPKNVVTNPRGVRLSKELDKWFLTLPHGEFSKIVNLVLEQYVKEQGIDLTEFEEEMNYND